MRTYLVEARLHAEGAALHQRLSSSAPSSGLVAVTAPPLWNLIGLVDCPQLIRTTTEWVLATARGPR